MEQLSKEEVLYDEHEERLKKTKARRRRTIRRRHRLHLIIALGIVLLILLYFASDLSKVRSLRVEGNRFYSDEQICEMAGVGYDTRYLLRPAFLMENALKGGSLIEDVQVEKSWNGDIRIKVEEKHVIGYLVQGRPPTCCFAAVREQITLQEDEDRQHRRTIRCSTDSVTISWTALAQAFDAVRKKWVVESDRAYLGDPPV